MGKLKMAVCIADEEYANRFVSCLMKYYQRQMELHIYDDIDRFIDNYQGTCAVCLLAGCMERIDEVLSVCSGEVIYLKDETETEDKISDGKEILFVDKYQEVNRIVEEILSHVSEDIKNVKETGGVPEKTRVIGVYSLSENEYQLPFAVTLGSIIGEHHRVLLLDLQENSGLTRILQQEHSSSLEEILVMAESGNYSKSRVASCIGHRNGLDFIYPVENTECLCEAKGETYFNLLSMLSGELDYDTLIVNFGSRFQGFTEVLNRCAEVYLMQKKGGLCQWREYEFMEELTRKGYAALAERIIKVEMPVMSMPVTSFERLVEQWKWNELGDLIRRMTLQVSAVG